MTRIGLRLHTVPQFSPRDMLGMASLAEERGYEIIWVPEGRTADALTVLTAFATVTKRIGLGTGILPVFSRTPTLTAMSAGNLDALSQGRFTLGLGTGHRGTVEDEHGVPFYRPLTRLRETVEIVRRLLRGEKITYEGRIYNLQETSLGFTLLRPDVPIYLAALRPQMLELAGEIADGVVLNWASPSYLPQAIEHLRRGAERAGRTLQDIDVACFLATAVVDDPAQVRPAIQRQIVAQFKSPFYRYYFEQTGFKEEAAAVSEALARGDNDAAADAVSEAMQDDVAIIGPAEHCRRQVEARRSLGVNLPVIAPQPLTGSSVEDFRATIEAFSGWDVRR